VERSVFLKSYCNKKIISSRSERRNFSNYKGMHIYTNSEFNFIIPSVQLLMSFMTVPYPTE
jgi:hypothetical protein